MNNTNTTQEIQGNCEYTYCTKLATKSANFKVLGQDQDGKFCDEHAEEFNGTHLMRFPWK